MMTITDEDNVEEIFVGQKGLLKTNILKHRRAGRAWQRGILASAALTPRVALGNSSHLLQQRTGTPCYSVSSVYTAVDAVPGWWMLHASKKPRTDLACGIRQFVAATDVSPEHSADVSRVLRLRQRHVVQRTEMMITHDDDDDDDDIVGVTQR